MGLGEYVAHCSGLAALTTITLTHEHATTGRKLAIEQVRCSVCEL